jgi:hypothetical protein
VAGEPRPRRRTCLSVRWMFAQDHTSVVLNGERSIFVMLNRPVTLGWSFCLVPQVTKPVAWNLFHATHNRVAAWPESCRSLLLCVD